MSFYEQNLQTLVEKNPKLATKLFSVKENKNFEVFVDEKDPLNINIADTKNSDVLYSGVPINETQNKLNEFVKYQRYPFLYFYGLGNGVFFKALLQNETLRRVVVVEPEVELIYIAFHFNDFTAEIKQDRLVLLDSEDMGSAEAIMIFMLAEAKLFCKTYTFFITLDYYERHYSDEIIRINTLFLQAIEHVVRGTGNSSVDALIGLKHQVANMDKMLETPTLMQLLKQCKNTQTAVIVSTGPSLKKQLPLLKKIKDYVTICCIDASFPILQKEDIKPDIVFSLERVIETAKFYSSVSKEFCEDVVFAITSIAHPDLFKEIKAGVLQISMRPFGYTRYFNKPDYGYLGIGMSAANMAYELVFHADFKNCILIGQDLAFAKDGATHSEGHIFGQADAPANQNAIYVPAYGGEGQVKTTVVWKLFKNFFETDISCANEKGIKTINATEGGARIEGALEMSFADAVKEVVDVSVKKTKIKLRNRKAVDILKDQADAKQKIKQMLIFAKQIKQEVEDAFLHVMHQCEIMDKLDQKRLYEEVDFQKLADIMSEIDHIKEYFAQQKFADIFIDATQALIMHQEIEIAQLQVRDARTDNDKRQKMIEWVYAHRYWLFSLAGLIQASIDAISMGIEMSLDLDKITTIIVEIDDKEIDTLHVNSKDRSINNIYDLKQMCINYQLLDKYKNNAKKLKFYYSDDERNFKAEVYMPSRDDEHYDEFVFKNSLEATIDKKRLENLYEKNVIGFLATQENLNDKDFMDYIKELMARFPDVTFKAFSFSDKQRRNVEILFQDNICKIQSVTPSDIYDFCQSLEVLISNHIRQNINSIDIKLIDFLIQYSQDVAFAGVRDLNHKNTTINDFEQQHQLYFNKFFENLEFFDCEQTDIARLGNTFHEIYLKKAGEKYGIKIDFSVNENIHEVIYWNLKLGFNNHNFFKDMLVLVRKFQS